MSYVITGGCIRCKYTDCVAVCPVDAFREGANMLVIDPAACIDCGVCEPECPESAIVPDLQADARWVDLNRRLAPEWPVILVPRPPPQDAGAFKGMPGKFEQYFSEKPAPAAA